MKNGFHVFSRVFPKMVGGLSVILFATSGSFASTIDLSKAVPTEGSVISVSDGDVLTDTLGGNYKISIANGATVTLKNAVINGVDNNNYKWAGLTCEGDCKIVLDEGSENSVKGFYEGYPGIYVPEGYTLTIEGGGKLDVYGGDDAAGIGCSYNSSCGNIVINGGTITATGGDYGAGIGSGTSNLYTTKSVGNITINGGTITATGGTNGAGIGGGFTYGSGTTTVGDITINGGTVTATCGDYGAGIGGGITKGTTTVGDITINGGTVTATGGYYGAGIGGGFTDISGTTTVGDITINGGTVTATGGHYGAGIGGGYTYNSGTATVGNITISDRVIMLTATAGYSARNSVGDGNGASSSIGTITVAGVETGPIKTNPFVYSNPNVVLDTLTNDYTATDGKILTGTLGGNYKISIANGATVTLKKAVINGANNKNYTWAGLTCEGDCKIVLAEGSVNSVWAFYRDYPGIYVPEGYTLTIEGGGKLDVYGGDDAAGIGCSENSSCGNIVINGGTITAMSRSYGAGIGGGVTEGGTATVGDIIINGGTVNATSLFNGAGIGSGRTFNSGTATVGNITINGGTVNATGGQNGAGIGGGVTESGTTTVGDITIKGGTVAAQGFVGIGKGKVQGSNAKAEIGPIRLYHGFKEIDATITENPIYMYGETDVSSNPSEYFGIDGSVTRSLYSIHYAENNLNGSVKGNNTTTTGKAYAGETVTATPDFGYSFKSLSVKDDEGNTVEVKDNSFVMPLGDVTVSADFASKYPMLTFSNNGKNVTVNGAYGGTETFELDEDISVESAVLNRNFAVADESSDKRARSTITLPFDIAAENVTGLSRVLAFKKVGPYIDRETGKEKTAMYVSYVWCAKGYGAENCPESDVVLEAYRPYIVELDLPKISLTGPVTLKKTAGVNTDSRSGDWVFRGMLRYKKWDATADKSQLTGCNGKSCIYGYAASGDKNILGQFVRIGEGAYIYPFRAYLGYEPEDQQPVQTLAPANASYVLRPDVHVRGEEIPENMDVVVDSGDGEHTTVIGQFNTRTGEFRMNGAATRRTFDAKGRNVGDKANKARGAYYGKKVLK